MTTISNLPPLTTVTNQIILPVVDQSSSPGITKKMTLPQLIAASIGPTGPRGLVGPAGAIGSLGYSGSIGIGYAGSLGPQGYTGSASTIPGYTGSSVLGYSGSASSIRGFTGSAAYTGSTGGGYTGSASSIRGYSGSIGFTGSIAYTGSSGAGYTGSASSVRGFTGSMAYTGSTGGGYTGSASSIRGYSGSMAYTGSAGSGYVGSQGYVGSKGPQGFTGSVGVQGPQGYSGSFGAQGPQGYAGSIGYTGSTGSQGAQGYSGSASNVAGPQGYTGSIGYAGSTGAGYVGSASDVAGPQGYTGSIGEQGAQGYSGSASDVAGPQGYSGSVGSGYVGSASDVVGPQGYTGSVGEQGPQGYVGSASTVIGPQGPQGYAGSQGTTGGATYFVSSFGASYYVINSTNNPSINLTRGLTYYFSIVASGHPFWIKTSPVTGTGSSYNSGVNNNGTDAGTIIFVVPYDAPSTLYYICENHSSMQGVFVVSDIGAQGIPGYTGSYGYTGSTGAGFTGSTGAGFTGSVGAQGPQGYLGYTGSVGSGYVGSASNALGPQGFTGSTGAGFTGSASDAVGPQGYTGSTGAGFTGSASNVIGYAGSVGEQGPQGPQGYSGSVGAQGPQGYLGYTGSASTVIGYAGSHGYSGSASDVIGPQGPQGPQGYTGSTGAQGYTGSTGAQGPQGYTGSSSPATGSNGSIQYNNSGTLVGVSSLTTDNSGNLVSGSILIDSSNRITFTPTGNAISTNGLMNVQSTTTNETTREFLVHIGLTNNKGSTQSAGSGAGDKVGLYTGITSTTGGGNAWALNALSRIDSGWTGVSDNKFITVAEFDLDNHKAHMDSVGNSWPNPKSVGLQFNGGSTYRSTTAIEVGTLYADRWNHALWVGQSAITRSSIIDVSDSPIILESYGNHTTGWNSVNASFSVAPILIKSGDYIKSNNSTSSTSYKLIGLEGVNDDVIIGDLTNTATIFSSQHLAPKNNDTFTLGNSSNKWSAVWAVNGTIQTSDPRLKTDINLLPSVLGIIDDINPVTFKWINGGYTTIETEEDREVQETEIKTYEETVLEVIDGTAYTRKVTKTTEVPVWEYIPILDENNQPVMVINPNDSSMSEPQMHRIPKMVVKKVKVINKVETPGNRTHWGFLADNVKSAMDKTGKDFGGYVLDSQGYASIRPDQLIPILWKGMKELVETINELKSEIAQLKS